MQQQTDRRGFLKRASLGVGVAVSGGSTFGGSSIRSPQDVIVKPGESFTPELGVHYDRMVVMGVVLGRGRRKCDECLIDELMILRGTVYNVRFRTGEPLVAIYGIVSHCHIVYEGPLVAKFGEVPIKEAFCSVFEQNTAG